MPGKRVELNNETLYAIEEIGEHMPGGFFIYKAEGEEELLYANQAVFDIYGCANLDEFKELTGYTFRGMVHPDDYREISDSIVDQISDKEEGMDHVEYRIFRKDGAVRWVDDYGHFTKTLILAVFIMYLYRISRRKESRWKRIWLSVLP